MTRALMTTTALGLALAATGAAANEWEVRVGGYMEQYVAYSDSDVEGKPNGEFGGVDSKQDAEIHFQPTLTLDNGLQFGANIELEGGTSTDQIDEANLFVEGSFGRVVLGSEASAGYQMFYAAPDVTFVNANSGSLTAFIPFSGATGVFNVDPALNTQQFHGNDIFLGTLGATFLENGSDTTTANSAAQRFTYYTPRFAGFQVGVSYARDNDQDSNVQQDLDGDNLNNLFDVGANYVQTYGDLDVALAGRYGIAQDDSVGGGNPTVWGAGLQIGYAGFRVGGSFAEQNDSFDADGRAFDAGVSYSTGPWGVSFTYVNGENVDNENLASDEELQQYLVGATYALAKGVTLLGFGAYVDFQEDVGDGGGQGDDIDGFVVGTGIKVEF